MHNNSFIAAVKDEHTYGEEMARIGRPKVIYKGTFVSNQSLVNVKTIRRMAQIFVAFSEKLNFIRMYSLCISPQTIFFSNLY